MLQDNGLHNLPIEHLHAGIIFEETNCPRITAHERVGKYYRKKMHVSKSTLLDTISYYSSGKIRCLRSSRKNAPLEKIVWRKNAHAPAY